MMIQVLFNWSYELVRTDLGNFDHAKVGLAVPVRMHKPGGVYLEAEELCEPTRFFDPSAEDFLRWIAELGYTVKYVEMGEYTIPQGILAPGMRAHQDIYYFIPI